ASHVSIAAREETVALEFMHALPVQMPCLPARIALPAPPKRVPISSQFVRRPFGIGAQLPLIRTHPMIYNVVRILSPNSHASLRETEHCPAARMSRPGGAACRGVARRPAHAGRRPALHRR